MLKKYNDSYACIYANGIQYALTIISFVNIPVARYHAAICNAPYGFSCSFPGGSAATFFLCASAIASKIAIPSHR